MEPHHLIIRSYYTAHRPVYTHTHNKEIFGLPKNYRYDITISKWKYFYQELEDYVSTFGFKAPVKIVTAIYAAYIPTEFKNFITYYPSITPYIVELHGEILWEDK